jgi:hypothetical protein
VFLDLTADDPVHAALARLCERRGLDAGPDVEEEGPDRIDAPEGWRAWRRILRNGTGGDCRDVYVRTRSDGGESVVIGISTPEDDETLRERLVRPFVSTFTFK